MPSAWRVHVLGERLRAAGFRAEVGECDIYSLSAGLRKPVTDAIVADHACFPMVLVGDVVACHSGVDIDTVLRAVREADPGECC